MTSAAFYQTMFKAACCAVFKDYFIQKCSRRKPEWGGETSKKKVECIYYREKREDKLLLTMSSMSCTEWCSTQYLY